MPEIVIIAQKFRCEAWRIEGPGHFSPPALAAATLDLVKERVGKTLPQLADGIPCRFQLEYAAALGFGSRDSALVRA